ncbi:DUF2877 domain-containing protein [Candidatus Clostridium stratigraminis]|uniref:DUF2877 domain-containing protein n=1 Tax=Candidatus Clostridium stratigraminis TaxID=3381661 RepID=A0ABW8T0Y4_9CLOT
MRAIYICKDLMNYITGQKNLEGQIHSVFKNACNIALNDKFITILSKDKYMGPMSLTVDAEVQTNFINIGFKQDLKMEINVNGIISSKGNIYINLQNVKLWGSEAELKPSALAEKNILDNLVVVENAIITKGNLYGIGPLINILVSEMPELNLMTFPINHIDANFNFIRNRFINFMNITAAFDIEKISNAADKVIGFGTGLTPSMDDFICGMMISFVYLGDYYKLNIAAIYTFNMELIKSGLKKTTKVSAEMLKHSSLGRSNEAVRQLLHSILHEIEGEKVIKALINTIGFGETSGTDTALGVYTGCRIMTNLRYRRFWLNDAMH